jgi:hypothetical protein
MLFFSHLILYCSASHAVLLDADAAERYGLHLHACLLSLPLHLDRKKHSVLLKGLSHEMNLNVWLVLGLNRGYILNFFRCSNDFLTQKLYFSRLKVV